MKTMAGISNFSFSFYIISTILAVVLMYVVVYVTALLRSVQFLSLPQVRAFVQLEADCLPPALQAITSAATGPGSSALTGSGSGSGFLSAAAAAAAAAGNVPNRDWSDNSISVGIADEDDQSNMRQSFMQAGMYSSSGYGDDEVDRESMISRPGAPTDSIQGKWRKVFLNMRVKLKPHEIAVTTIRLLFKL